MTNLQSYKAAQSNGLGTAVVPMREHGNAFLYSHQSLDAKSSTTEPCQNHVDKLLNMNAKASENTREVAFDKLTAESRFANSSEALQQSAQSSETSQESDIAQKIDILGMDFDNLTPEEFLSSLRKGVVFTPNVDHLMKLRNDPEFASVYQRADFKICDSQIVMYASRFLGTPLKAKLSGSDLFPWFCEHHKTNDSIRIFLLGGQAGVAKEACDRINARIGREIVVGEYSPPFGFEGSVSECDEIISQIEQSSANVVAVCLGAPKQEKWIAANCDRLPGIDIFMAVGAVVDFEAGAKPRAPRFVSDLGLEWLYRLMCEPRRLWRRYLLEDMPFLGLVVAEKLRRLTDSRR